MPSRPVTALLAVEPGVDPDDVQRSLPADADFFRQIVTGVIKGQLQIDPAVDSALVDSWPMGRIDATLRAILRAATFELLKRKDIPSRVVITEYVDVAKAFYEDEAPRMVNAVLDQVAKVAGRDNDPARVR